MHKERNRKHIEEGRGVAKPEILLLSIKIKTPTPKNSELKLRCCDS